MIRSEEGVELLVIENDITVERVMSDNAVRGPNEIVEQFGVEMGAQYYVSIGDVTFLKTMFEKFL
jgi:hypothetical protein